MGKVQKNFALLKRSSNPHRVSLRKLLQANSDSSEASGDKDDEKSGKMRRRKVEEEEEKGDESPAEGRTRRTRQDDTDWTPSLSALFKILFSMRLSASLWSLISDCDEVYNYWEPLHLVLFGRGFQTWEYSPVYAIRSWLYILLYAGPVKLLLPFLGHSKVILFFSMRFIIGFFTLLSEILFYRALCHRFSNFLGRSYVLISLFSSAMFAASCAFLPSSFSMTMNMFAMAFFLREQWFLAISFTAISALMGWPFAAVLGLPIAMEMLLIRPKKLALKFAVYSTLVGAALIGLLYAVDSYFFGRPVLAPLNIVLYNVFSPHGPNIYGVEPVSYYMRNLLLNFNMAFPMAIFAIPFASLLYFFTREHEKRRKDAEPTGRIGGRFAVWSLRRWHCFRPVLLLSLTALVWLLIFFLQPHKEERFLFPIYPHICLLAAICLECLCRLMPKQSLSISLCTLFIGVFILISFSRTIALHRNYSGLMDTYKMFNDRLQSGQIDLTEIRSNNGSIRLCVGKEWHRFPSSFFLPEQVTVPNREEKYQVELNFVRSEFRGLLPGHFAAGPIPNVTQQIPQGMNDLNREELMHYVSLNSCDFLLDLVGSTPTEFEPDYTKMPLFKSVIEQSVLLPAQSHPIFRAFYIPFTPKDYLKFGVVHVLQQLRQTKNIER